MRVLVPPSLSSPSSPLPVSVPVSACGCFGGATVSARGSRSMDILPAVFIAVTPPTAAVAITIAVFTIADMTRTIAITIAITAPPFPSLPSTAPLTTEVSLPFSGCRGQCCLCLLLPPLAAVVGSVHVYEAARLLQAEVAVCDDGGQAALLHGPLMRQPRLRLLPA